MISDTKVGCTISGNACSSADGAQMCSCVGCTVWRSREASVVPAVFAPALNLNFNAKLKFFPFERTLAEVDAFNALPPEQRALR